MRLNHVTLIVSHLDTSIAFYRALGFKPIVLEEPRSVRFILPDGDATLSLEMTGEPVDESTAQVYLEFENLDDVCTQLKANGMVFEQEPTDMDYLWREARLRDPDGHQVRLYFAGNNRLNPPWRLPLDE